MAKPLYDPFKHHRRTVRYADWDYRAPGYYFITICTNGKQSYFDDQNIIVIAQERLLKLLTYDSFQHVALDEWIVMPNHIHLILWLMTWPEGIGMEPEKKIGFSHVQSGSIGAIVSTYKSQVTKRVKKIKRQTSTEFWQTGYWDRIIRDEAELNQTRQYIIENPARWAEDRENLDALLNKMTYHNS